jgi:hypothetical protein
MCLIHDPRYRQSRASDGDLGRRHQLKGRPSRRCPKRYHMSPIRPRPVADSLGRKVPTQSLVNRCLIRLAAVASAVQPLAQGAGNVHVTISPGT